MTDTSSNKQKKKLTYTEIQKTMEGNTRGFNFGYVVLTHYITIRHVVKNRSADLSFLCSLLSPSSTLPFICSFCLPSFFLFLPSLICSFAFSFLACFLPFILFFLSLPASPFPHSVLHAIPPFGQGLTAYEQVEIKVLALIYN